MTRQILERIVKVSSEHPNFDEALLKLLDEFELGTYNPEEKENKKKEEEKPTNPFITFLIVLAAIILLGLLTVIVIYSFFDVPVINHFVDGIQDFASNLTS